jgi:hypothetical protein
VVELHILAGIIFVRRFLNVIDDFFPFGVVFRPIGVIFEQKLEARGGDIASNARIPVFQPDTANVYSASDQMPHNLSINLWLDAYLDSCRTAGGRCSSLDALGIE